MIYVLVGKSGSGKSTIERLLERKGYTRIISYTTRPIRENEVNGIDYHFVPEEEFENIRNTDGFIEETEYREWHYGIRNDLQEGKDYVAVLEPNGLKKLQDVLGRDKVMTIYIYVNDKERLLRSLNREINPNVNEIVRRFTSDKELFKDVEKTAVYKINNLNADQSAKIIDRIIRTESKNYN